MLETPKPRADLSEWPLTQAEIVDARILLCVFVVYFRGDVSGDFGYSTLKD